MHAAATIDLRDFEAELRKQSARPDSIDWRPALKVTAVYLEGEAKLCFDESRTPDGQPWAPIKHPMEGRGAGAKPLRDTDTLMAGMTASHAAGAVRRIDDTELIFGSNDSRAATHNFGATITPKNAKALTIPLTIEAARAGSPRNFPRPLFVLKPKDGGKSYLAERIGKRLKKHYLFSMKSVIPARQFVGLSERNIEDIQEIARDFGLEQWRAT